MPSPERMYIDKPFRTRKLEIMKIVKIILIILVLFLVNCTTNDDVTKKKAILAFALDCKGGTTADCFSYCNTKCGVSSSSTLTPDTSYCVNSCQTSCTTSCSVFTLYTTLNRKP